jgi:uncharacterized protein YjbI with pentapeptide repeats
MAATAPSLPRQLMQGRAPVEINDGLQLENLELSGIDWASQSAARAQLATLRLIDPDLTASILREGGWSDIEVVGGQLSGMNLTGSSWRRMSLTRARLSGIVCAETELKDVTFIDAKIDLANFRFASLRRVHFLRCYLAEADFATAKLVDVSFADCDLTNAGFSGANMTRVDFRGSALLAIKGIGGLKGAEISTQQAIGLLPEFAAELGIIYD